MAMATTADSIPVVDLRLLSQSEIHSLALSSANSFSLDTLSDVVPKIDRSVFNESAGSRKQTYSRLPLLQQSQPQPQNPQPQPRSPNPQSQPHLLNPPLPRRRGRPRLHPLPNPPAATKAPPDLGLHDNVQIVSILKKLFEPHGKCSYKDSSDKEKKNDNNHNNNNNSIVLVSDGDRDREARNGKGDVVDLAALMKTEDLLGPEIRRRTEGLWTEEQILGYMTGLDGQWGSIRKKSKVVDAAVFGDGLPKGWKVLLGLKRKEKIVYLHCQRYISPSGKQFMSCKEVSSYILSLNELQDVGQPIAGQHDDRASRTDKLTLGSVGAFIDQDDNSKEIANCSFGAPISYVSTESEKPGQLFRVKKQAVSESDISLACHNCSLIFGDKEAHLQFLTNHQRSAKRHRLGQSLTDGVIVKDGKYECQFCHKTFTERHHYDGHIGAHIGYEGLGVDTSAQNNNARTGNEPSSLAVVPHVPSEMNILADKNGEAYTINSVNNPGHIDLPPCTLEANMSGIRQNPNAGIPETTEVVSSKCKKGIELDPVAGLSEITEAVLNNSKKEIEHNPMAGPPEITEAVSGKNTIEDDPKVGAPEITEAISSSELIDSQIEDYKLTCDVAEDIFSVKDVVVKSNSCADVISAYGSDMNNVSHTCSPIMIQEPSKIEYVHDQINDCAGDAVDNNVQDGKPFRYLDAIASTSSEDAITCKTLSETGLSSPKSKTGFRGCYNLQNLSNHVVVGYKSENDKDASNAMNVEIAEEIGLISSKGKLVDAQGNNCDITGYRSEIELVDAQGNNCDITGYRSEIVDATDAMSIDGNACMDKTTYENPNSIHPSSCTLISPFGNCNGDQKVQEDRHFLSLSGNGQSYGIETYASNIFTFKMEESVEVNASIHDESDTALTNKDTAIAGSTQNKLNTSYVFPNTASEPTSGIETNADCMFSGDLNKSLLEGIDGVGSEFQDYFHRSNVSSEEAAGVITSDGDRRRALQVNLADQSSSWLQSSHSLPIVDLNPSQRQDELRGTVPRNEQTNISDFGDLRLGSIGPADFSLFTGQPSASVPMELVPDDQLEWGAPLTKMMTTSVRTSVCIWCGSEFSLVGVEPEQPSESLGYLCPDCKSKISRQLGLLNNGLS